MAFLKVNIKILLNYFIGYWYEEGYIKTCSREYTNRNFNRLIHLTNDAV